RERISSGSNPRSSSRSSSRSNPTGATDIAGAPIPPIHVSNAAGESLVRDARAILLGLPPGQTMPVRQLTQAMLRKGKLSGTPDQLWRMVKGMLLVSEQRRITRGHERIVRYHGKDLFSAEQLPRRSAVDLAAAALNRAAEEYAAAVAGETQSRLSALALPMLERIVHIYLQTAGWTDIQWVRRVENSSYAVATPSGAVEPTMVAVRCGPTEVDRRGVGELRAGVYAKDLVAGLLISPCDLSEEAQVELAKEGSHVGLLCGKDLIRELTAREIGVTWRHIQLPDVDQRFYDAVLS
ncbi:MAG: restriction endonuclease, partial [Kofleriaceae bacterium]|nr:restriction endonuclease [Kofleriaceae bacterium]